MNEDFEQANIIKAPGCPHWMPRDVYDSLFLAFDGVVAAIKCERCYVKPVRVYGEFDRPGPRRGPRPSKRRDGLTVSERDRALYGRAA